MYFSHLNYNALIFKIKLLFMHVNYCNLVIVDKYCFSLLKVYMKICCQVIKIKSFHDNDFCNKLLPIWFEGNNNLCLSYCHLLDIDEN